MCLCVCVCVCVCMCVRGRSSSLRAKTDKENIYSHTTPRSRHPPILPPVVIPSLDPSAADEVPWRQANLQPGSFSR